MENSIASIIWSFTFTLWRPNQIHTYVKQLLHLLETELLHIEVYQFLLFRTRLHVHSRDLHVDYHHCSDFLYWSRKWQLLLRCPFVLVDQILESILACSTEGTHFVCADKKLRYKRKVWIQLVLLKSMNTQIALTNRAITCLKSGHGTNSVLCSKVL